MTKFNCKQKLLTVTLFSTLFPSTATSFSPHTVSPPFYSHPLPSCVSPAFSRKWSQSSSRITWNNLDWGAPFSLSFTPPPSAPLALLSPPLLTGPGQLICFRSQLCVQSTVCSQQGAWRPAFVSTIPLWTLCASANASVCCIRLQSNSFMETTFFDLHTIKKEKWVKLRSRLNLHLLFLRFC